MNASLILTALVVLLTGLLAWFQQDRLTTLRVEHTTLVKRATALGLSVDGVAPTKSEGTAAVTGGGQAVGTASRSKATAQEFSKELFAFVKLMKEYEGRGGDAPPEVQREAMMFFQRLLELDAEVMAHLIDEIRSSSELAGKEKGEVIMIGFMAMAQSSPRKALELFANSKDLVKEMENSKHMVQMALGAWAAEDPEAALAWLKLNDTGLPEGVAEEARKGAVAAAFRTNPELAIRTALDLDRETISAIGSQIGMFVTTPEDQLKLLQALKGELGGLPGAAEGLPDQQASKEELLRGGMITGLAASLAKRPFAEATEFLEGAGLNARESGQIAQRMSNQGRNLNEPGEWLPWIHEHSLGATGNENVKRVVHRWTTTDFRSTAAWIGEQPDGPLREQATYEFANTVAPHEPESAAEWAVTLPKSEERTTLLKHVHENWKKSDEAAAAEFAAKHGLEE